MTRRKRKVTEIMTIHNTTNNKHKMKLQNSQQNFYCSSQLERDLYKSFKKYHSDLIDLIVLKDGRIVLFRNF
jgi:hypothetical protein